MLRKLLAAFSVLALAGCTYKPEGRYETATGGMVLEFKSGKAHVTLPMEGTKEIDYEVKGDRIILNLEGDKEVLIHRKDGSLEIPNLGTLTKKGS
jgi:hypothetical protein